MHTQEVKMPEDDTTIRISREEKQALDMARNAWEKQVGRRVTAGEFVRFLSERYLREVGDDSKGAKPKSTSGLIAVQQVKSAEPQSVSPGPQVFLVACTRCGGQIGWRPDLSSEGYCPYCGIYLRLKG